MINENLYPLWVDASDGPTLERLPVGVIEFDENSKYLFVLKTKNKLSDSELDRLITSIRREWTGFLQDDNWKFLILDEGMELETYQFKPKDDNDGN